MFMLAQLVDALEFRGKSNFLSQKDGKNYTSIIFEDSTGRQFRFFDNAENVPDDVISLVRGAYYFLTVDVYPSRSGYGCRYVSAAPAEPEK